MSTGRAGFAAAANAVAIQVAALDGAAIHVNGASGFLASNLLALLDAAARRGGPQLDLHASARRPATEVGLFGFLGRRPEAAWEIAAAETTQLPEVPGLIAVHTASYGAPADYLRSPVETFRANTDGLIRTFAEAERVQARHVVYLSSAEVYGQPPDHAIPTAEDVSGAPALEDPRSIYAESKRMGEVLGRALSAQTGIPLTIVRPWNLYGPGQRLSDGRVPMAFMRSALEHGRVSLSSDGRSRRSPCFAWDGLVQLAACLDPATAAGEALNIGNPDGELAMAELARACALAAGVDEDAVGLGDAPGAGPQRSVPSTARVGSRARAPLPPLTDLPEGLAVLREWVQWSLTDR